MSLSGVGQFHGFAGSARVGFLKKGHMTNPNIAQLHVRKTDTPAAGRTSTFGIFVGSGNMDLLHLSSHALAAASFASPRQLHKRLAAYNQRAHPFEWTRGVAFSQALKTNTLVYGNRTRSGYNPHCVATMVTS